jgi:hypothetical protein
MCRVYTVVLFYAGLPDCPASDQSGTGMEKMLMPEAARYGNNGTIVRYRTEKPEAGTSMSNMQNSLKLIIESVNFIEADHYVGF